MDLKQLKTFILVAETGSLSKASDRLRLAQPSLSRHIRMLEDSLGVPLFSRTGRGMHLTDAGQLLLRRVTGLVHQLESSLDEVRSSVSAPRGQVSFGMMPTVSYFLAARLIKRAATELPGVSLRVVEGYAGHLIDWLHRGEIDATLLYGPATDIHARTQTIAYEELVLVEPGETPRASGSAITVKELALVDLILPSRPHGLRAVVEQAARKAGATLKIAFEADSFHVLKELVETGLGATILPRSAFAHEVAAGRLRGTPILKPKLMREIVLALPPGRSDTRATQAVADLLHRELAQLIDSGAWKAVLTGRNGPPKARAAPPAPGRRAIQPRA